jgi:hypothetical protein
VAPTRLGRGAITGVLALLLAQEPDPGAHIVRGRFIQPDGSLTRTPQGAVGIRIAGGADILAGHGGATFMDYDGAPQTGGADLTTRGMRTQSGQRWYLDVYGP